MPCFNAAATVAHAVESIRSQSLPDWELIVVDDGSTDGSADIVAGIAPGDARIRVARVPHGGVAAASNHGFSLSRAPVVARMDADDVSRRDRLEIQLDQLLEHPWLGAVTCLAQFAGDAAAAGGYAHHVEWTNRQRTPEAIGMNRFIDLPFAHPTLMYRRELVETHGGYLHGDFPEDYEMVLRWMAAGVKIGKIAETLYDWHDPPARLSRNDARYDPMAFHRCKAPYLAQAIAAAGCCDRELWVWGAGRPARKCAAPLEQAWKPASGFIDIDPRKIGRVLHGRPVVSPGHLPPTGSAVIASYVGTRGARDSIRSELLRSGREEGVDFWICA